MNMTEQVALNHSRLLLKIFDKIHKHYNYLQSVLKQKLLPEVIKNAKVESLRVLLREGVKQKCLRKGCRIA